jgi:predicted dehydrogenase
MKTLRAGVIGLGIGVRHLQSFRDLEGVEIAGIADVMEAAAKKQADAYGGRPYANAMEMLEKERLDVVSICTPPKSHRELTQAAARVGTHVLCEKPMAPSVSDCDAMVEACAHAGVKLMVAQKKRFHPLIQRVRRLTETDLGPVRWAVAKYALGKVPKDWFWQENDGGGPLLENSIHTVDMLRYLMGEVETVYAEGDNLFNPDRTPQLDVATYTFRFVNGAVAAVGSGQASEWAFANEFFFLACDGGEIRISGPFDRPVNWWLGRRADGSQEEETIPVDDCFDREIVHFLDCVRNDETPLVTGEDARGSVAVCLAVKESARTKKTVRVTGDA